LFTERLSDIIRFKEADFGVCLFSAMGMPALSIQNHANFGF